MDTKTMIKIKGGPCGHHTSFSIGDREIPGVLCAKLDTMQPWDLNRVHLTIAVEDLELDAEANQFTFTNPLTGLSITVNAEALQSISNEGAHT